MYYNLENYCLICALRFMAVPKKGDFHISQYDYDSEETKYHVLNFHGIQEFQYKEEMVSFAIRIQEQIRAKKYTDLEGAEFYW